MLIIEDYLAVSLVSLLMWRRPPCPPPPLFTKQWTKVPTAWRRENNPDFIFRSLAFKLVLGSNSQLTRKNDFVITRQDSTDCWSLLPIWDHLQRLVVCIRGPSSSLKENNKIISRRRKKSSLLMAFSLQDTFQTLRVKR